MTTLSNQHVRISSLPTLTHEEIEDARFRARDRAWATIAGLFEDLSDTEDLTYEALATRIGRKKSQVHRWLDSSCNMTLQSVGLLAEGLNVDLVFLAQPRERVRSNSCHPSESAAISCKIGRSQVRQSVTSKQASDKILLPKLKFNFDAELAMAD